MVLSNHVRIFLFSWIFSATVCVMFGRRSPGSRFSRERVGNKREQGASVSEGENNIITALYYDRMCRAEKRLMNRRLFREFKYLSVNPWHATRHCANYRCNSHIVWCLKLRARNANSSFCEKTFAWLRGCARTFISMCATHHRFCALAYCKLDNDLVDKGDLSHLVVVRILVVIVVVVAVAVVVVALVVVGMCMRHTYILMCVMCVRVQMI